MLPVLDPLRQFTIHSVVLRLTLAVIAGGILGLNRAKKGRAAGFRTHMFVCMGAALTMLLSQYYTEMLAGSWSQAASSLGAKTDVSRIGAQVISGIGFLGAGTILVTSRQEVKGLTTAAGFFEGSILVAVLILFAELVFSKIEYRILDKTQEMNVFMEYSGNTCLANVLNLLREANLKLLDIEITRNGHSDSDTSDALFVIRTNRRYPPERVIELLRGQEGSVLVQEL